MLCLSDFCCVFEIFKIFQILFIILNKTIRCQMEKYVTSKIVHFYIASLILKIIATSLERKLMYKAFALINAKHEECR